MRQELEHHSPSLLAKEYRPLHWVPLMVNWKDWKMVDPMVHRMALPMAHSKELLTEPYLEHHSPLPLVFQNPQQ